MGRIHSARLWEFLDHNLEDGGTRVPDVLCAVRAPYVADQHGSPLDGDGVGASHTQHQPHEVKVLRHVCRHEAGVAEDTDDTGAEAKMGVGQWQVHPPCPPGHRQGEVQALLGLGWGDLEQDQSTTLCG